MATKLISDLTPADVLTGDEFVPTSQSGSTRRVTLTQLSQLAPAGPPGVAGADGVTGPPGVPGDDGSGILSGPTAPTSDIGVDGDFYLETNNSRLYGPKTAVSWGSGTSLIGVTGSAGSPGAPGADGAPGPAGPTGSPGPAGADSTVPGPTGPQGVPGGSISIFKFRATTGTSGDPGAGKIKWNNASQVSATALLIDTVDQDGMDITLGLSALAPDEEVYLQEYTNAANWQNWKVTSTANSGGWYTIGTTLLGSAGVGTTGFQSNTALAMRVKRSGPPGPAGPPGVVAATAPATYNSGTQTIGVALGTTATTAAAGDDARIVGAAQKVSNLADLTDPVAARANLGLTTVFARSLQLMVSDPNGAALTTGTGKVYWTVPIEYNGYKITAVQASVTTQSTSGLPTVQITNATTTNAILSTPATIDINESTSYTAATPSVVNVANSTLVTGNLLRVDVTTAGTGTKGLSILVTLGP